LLEWTPQGAHLSSFLKKLLIKNAISFHFSFFWPYKGLEDFLAL
jgi:hypothetical protein